MLGRYGASVLGRGLPRTYRFAQARVVFAVARSRCEELFDAPNSVTLWKLPSDVEDRFDERWQTWLAQSGELDPFLDDIAASDASDLLADLEQRDLISP